MLQEYTKENSLREASMLRDLYINKGKLENSGQTMYL